MSGVDSTIQPGTLEEKYEIMKARKVADGSWNEDSELELRRVLGMNDAPVQEEGEVTPEAASTDVPAVTKPRSKSRIKAKK